MLLTSTQMPKYTALRPELTFDLREKSEESGQLWATPHSFLNLTSKSLSPVPFSLKEITSSEIERRSRTLKSLSEWD